MKIKLDNKDSKVIKDNKIYTLLDNTKLNNLVVSKTILHPNQKTTGHKHKGQEEVYQFISGHGKMEVNPEWESDFDGAIEMRNDLCKAKGWFNCNQFHNYLNIEAHYNNTGPDIN